LNSTASTGRTADHPSAAQTENPLGGQPASHSGPAAVVYFLPGFVDAGDELWLAGLKS